MVLANQDPGVHESDTETCGVVCTVQDSFCGGLLSVQDSVGVCVVQVVDVVLTVCAHVLVAVCVVVVHCLQVRVWPQVPPICTLVLPEQL